LPMRPLRVVGVVMLFDVVRRSSNFVLVLMAIAVVAEIAVPIAVPTMIVLEAAVVGVPIPRKELSSLITRPDPGGAGIRWASPISVVPLVVVSDRVPITVHPEVIRSGGTRPAMNDARRRRGPNSHSDR
jgi:hypothetical protein